MKKKRGLAALTLQWRKSIFLMSTFFDIETLEQQYDQFQHDNFKNNFFHFLKIYQSLL